MNKLSERIEERFGLYSELCDPMEDEKLVNGVVNLETLKRELKGIDVVGLRAIATELAKSKPPYRWSSLWRDCGMRQRRIGKQLLRVCEALKRKE